MSLALVRCNDNTPENNNSNGTSGNTRETTNNSNNNENNTNIFQATLFEELEEGAENVRFKKITFSFRLYMCL